MIFYRTVRHLHFTKSNFATEKSLLAALRKKTGYTFANCKKALEMHNNDLTKAENWLKEQAQALGWSKATKLENRATAQGLIGVAIRDQTGVLVEVNCETDFVARNKEFQDMVSEAADTCLNYAKKHRGQAKLTKICLDSDQLRNLKLNEGTSLADKLALMIGKVGENASLKRALCIQAADGIHLAGYAHPSGTVNHNIQLGRLGGILIYKSPEQNETINEISRGLCQHIVGMDPKKIGSSLDKPAANKEEENCFIHQEYLLDDSLTVKDVIAEHNLEILDFKRFECGESAQAAGEQPLDFVETCQ